MRGVGGGVATLGCKPCAASVISFIVLLGVVLLGGCPKFLLHSLHVTVFARSEGIQEGQLATWQMQGTGEEGLSQVMSGMGSGMHEVPICS